MQSSKVGPGQTKRVRTHTRYVQVSMGLAIAVVAGLVPALLALAQPVSPPSPPEPLPPTPLAVAPPPVTETSVPAPLPSPIDAAGSAENVPMVPGAAKPVEPGTTLAVPAPVAPPPPAPVAIPGDPPQAFSAAPAVSVQGPAAPALAPTTVQVGGVLTPWPPQPAQQPPAVTALPSPSLVKGPNSPMKDLTLNDVPTRIQVADESIARYSIISPKLVHPMNPHEVPALPGSDLLEPSDLEFSLYGRLESCCGVDYRSPVPTDWGRLTEVFPPTESMYLSGPSGHD
jgi:hypothetical protein